MKVPDARIAAFRVTGIRERMGTQTPHGSVINHHLNILYEIGRRLAAMAVDFREIVAADHCQNLLDLTHWQSVNTFAVDHGSVSIDLNEQGKARTAVRSAQPDASENRVGLCHWPVVAGSCGDTC